MAATTTRYTRTGAESMSARATRARTRLSQRRSTLTTKSTVDSQRTTVSSYEMTIVGESSSSQPNKSSQGSTASEEITPFDAPDPERPSFTSIETPDLLFRVDSMESVQSDSSTLHALREKVKELDGLLEELADEDNEDFDEDGIIEELYSLEYAEQKLKQELDAVDLLLSPTLTTLSAEQRDAAVTTLIESLDCGEAANNAFEVVVQDDDERVQPPDCCGSGCSDGSTCDVSSIQKLYAMELQNAWSRNFMEEEQPEEEVVFGKQKKYNNNNKLVSRQPSDILSSRTPPSPTKGNSDRKRKTQKFYTITLQSTPEGEKRNPVSPKDSMYNIDIFSDILSDRTEEEDSNLLTPCSYLSDQTNASSIRSILDHQQGTQRKATDREIGILSIPTLETVTQDQDSVLFCCLSTKNVSELGCDDVDDYDIIFPDPGTPDSRQLSPIAPSPISSTPFSPICELDKSRLSKISEEMSFDLLSPNHAQNTKAASRARIHSAQELDNGSGVFDGIDLSKDESTNSSMVTKKGSNFAKKINERKAMESPANGSTIFDGLMSPCTLLSPCSDGPAAKKGVFNFELENNEKVQDRSVLLSPRTPKTPKTRKIFNSKQNKRIGNYKSIFDNETGFVASLEPIKDESPVSSPGSQASPTIKKNSKPSSSSPPSSPKTSDSAKRSPSKEGSTSPLQSPKKLDEKFEPSPIKGSSSLPTETVPNKENRTKSPSKDFSNSLSTTRSPGRISLRTDLSSPSTPRNEDRTNGRKSTSKLSEKSKSSDDSASSDTDSKSSSKPQHHLKATVSPRAITDSLQFELQFVKSADLLSSGSSNPSSQMQRTILLNSQSSHNEQLEGDIARKLSPVGTRPQPISPRQVAPPRKLCLDNTDEHQSDFGEILTPHNGEETVSPLQSFRSWSNKIGDDENLFAGGSNKPSIHQVDVQRKMDERQAKKANQSTEEVPFDEKMSIRQQSKTGQSLSSMQVVNSYDDPRYFDGKDAEHDKIVDTLGRIYLQNQLGKYKTDDPTSDIPSIQESINQGGISKLDNSDDDSIDEAIARLAKRIQAQNFSNAEANDQQLANSSNVCFIPCCDDSIECALFDGICNVDVNYPFPPKKLEQDNIPMPSLAISTSSSTCDADMSYLVEGISFAHIGADMSYQVDGPMALQDGACSEGSPDLRLTEVIDAHVICLSPRAPKLPLREELPSLGVELVFNEKKLHEKKLQAPLSPNSSGDLSALKENKRRIENGLLVSGRSFSEASPTTVGDLRDRKRQIETDIQLEQSLSLEDYDHFLSNSPRRQPNGRVFLPSIDDSPTPKIKNTIHPQSPQRKKIDRTPKHQKKQNHEYEPENRSNRVLDKDIKPGLSSYSSTQNRQDDKVSREIETLLRRNEELLRSIAKFDFPTYQSLVTDDLTGIEPGSKGQVQQQQAFHRYFLDKSTLVDISMITPCVRFVSDGAAVVSYIRLDRILERDGTMKTKRTSETRIWEKGQGERSWVNCHYHQSVTE